MTSATQDEMRRLTDYSSVYLPIVIDRPLYRIEPAELATASEYDNMCSTLPRTEALKSFKQKYPEKFIDNSTDEKMHQVFENWQKAYKFWNGEYSIVGQRKIQVECPQEVQAIRAHLWEIIQEESLKTEEELINKWYFKYSLRIRDCLYSTNCKLAMIISLIIAGVVLVVFKM